MNSKYFEDTDTLLITLLVNAPVTTEEVDENTYLDFDDDGNLCSITIEHAQDKMGVPDVHFERIVRTPKKSFSVC
ncbi:MAG: DUF2283 domain-containing protein [Chthoniobacterales bacterium]|nr:DUF2283 domain-containing protein [Chthoniobacterales bacterium]